MSRLTRKHTFIMTIIAIIILVPAVFSAGWIMMRPFTESPPQTGYLLMESDLRDVRDLPQPAPLNPWLADSVYPIPHGNAAQQDSIARTGPEDEGVRRLQADELQYIESGPFQFGQFTSSAYDDGRRVIWGSGPDRIVKIDHDRREILDVLPLEQELRYSVAQGDKIISNLESLPSALLPGYMLTRLAPLLMDLSSVYTMLDCDNRFYVGFSDNNESPRGIRVYSDLRAGDPDSPIALLDTFIIPEQYAGALVGINMTFDGRVLIATEEGWLLAIERDFSDLAAINLKPAHHQPEDNGNGYGWIRNTFAVDTDGGIYVVSNDYLHKVVWTGKELSTKPDDGAWVERYPNDRGLGSGSTPSLMGFGDEDRLVVITDGNELMNIVLYWRDKVPKGWTAPQGAPSNRIAGMMGADMGGLVDKVQSEQSVLVSGYGAAVVNNEPRNMPGWLNRLDPRMGALVVGFLGNDSRYQPYGIQKFRWNAEEDELKPSWVNAEVSSLNCLPIISTGSRLLYTVGARGEEFSLEALDWDTGELQFTWILGGQQFNTLYSGLLIDEKGNIHYTSLWGKVHILNEPRIWSPGVPVELNML